ncbi:MAG: hypothetical protein HC828_15275 [Blastochloris sp.]|nr:hypothetical protein [Blastochloris sp.]
MTTSTLFPASSAHTPATPATQRAAHSELFVTWQDAPGETRALLTALDPRQSTTPAADYEAAWAMLDSIVHLVEHIQQWFRRYFRATT